MSYRYSYASPDAPVFDTRHEAIGELAVVLRENGILAPGAASGFVLVADSGGGP